MVASEDMTRLYQGLVGLAEVIEIEVNLAPVDGFMLTMPTTAVKPFVAMCQKVGDLTYGGDIVTLLEKIGL